MDPATPFPIKKAFLYSLVISVVLSALLGIATILMGRFGWVETRIMLTTSTVALGSLVGLACGAYLGTRAGRLLPLAGIALTFVAAAMIVLGMWAEVNVPRYWKFAATFSVFAVACGHLCLLSMARIAHWFQWSLIAARVVIFGVASLITIMIQFEIGRREMFQLLGVAAIVDTAITVLIPIFHRLSRSDVSASERAADITKIDAEIARLRARIADLEQMKLDAE